MSLCSSLLSSGQEAKADPSLSELNKRSLHLHHPFAITALSSPLLVRLRTRIHGEEGGAGCVFPFSPVLFTQDPLDVPGTVYPASTGSCHSPHLEYSLLSASSNSTVLKDLPQILLCPEASPNQCIPQGTHLSLG